MASLNRLYCENLTQGLHWPLLRAFVCCGRLTAVSQYDHYAVYPSLKPHVDCIRALIAAEWRKIHSDIGVSSYCADFCYFPNEKRVRLIEISPFLPCTGPACFDWSKDGASPKVKPS